eukprot:4126365-Pleurochrysis_carterae.AAC.1
MRGDNLARKGRQKFGGTMKGKVWGKREAGIRGEKWRQEFDGKTSCYNREMIGEFSTKKLNTGGCKIVGPSSERKEAMMETASVVAGKERRIGWGRSRPID